MRRSPLGVAAPTIAIITAYYAPKNSVGSYRMAAFAQAFRLQGWRCTVVAPTFGLRDDEAPDTVRVASGALANHPSLIVRFLIEAWVSLRLLLAARHISTDVRLVTSPYLACLLFAPLMLNRTRLALDIRDLTWAYPLRSDVAFRWSQRILSRWALWALRSAALVSVANTEQANCLAGVVRPDRILVVPNGIEEPVLERLSKQARYSGCETRLMYAGALGQAQGVSILASLARRAPDLAIDIYGAGIERREIEIAGRTTPNLQLHRPLSRESLLDAYATATILFLRLRPGFETAIPCKIYEYAAVGLPIVFMGPDGACWREMSVLGGTSRVDDGDVEGLLAAVRTLSGSPARQAAKVNVRIARARWTREATAAGLVAELAPRFGGTALSRQNPGKSPAAQV